MYHHPGVDTDPWFCYDKRVNQREDLMTKSQLQQVWNDLVLQMEEGSLDESTGHDKFSDLLTENGLTWETLWS